MDIPNIVIFFLLATPILGPLLIGVVFLAFRLSERLIYKSWDPWPVLQEEIEVEDVCRLKREAKARGEYLVP